MAADPTTTLASDVLSEALAPISVTTDGQSSAGRSMADVGYGIQLAAAIKAANRPNRGIRFTRLIPSGPSGWPICGSSLNGLCGPFDQVGCC